MKAKYLLFLTLPLTFLFAGYTVHFSPPIVNLHQLCTVVSHLGKKL